VIQIRRIGKVMDYRYTPEVLAEPPNESYGHKLRRLRLALGLTQAYVAEMVGCTKQTVSNWEREVYAGNTPEAARLPRHAIALLSQRIRDHQKRMQISATNNRRVGSNNQSTNGTGGVPAQTTDLRPRRKAQR